MSEADPAGLAAHQWFDNHCHLTTMKGDPGEAIAVAREAGVTRLLTVGCDVADSQRAIALAAEFDGVWATAGVHPHDAAAGIDGLEALVAAGSVAAVGECGLDYHYDNSPREAQREVFAAQIEMAHRHDLALVIHSREAWDDTFAILDEIGIPPATVFHCFTGGPAEAEGCLERGALLSFSGIVTFPSAGDLRAAAELTPPDRMLIETDSPFLTPVPHRGRPNDPSLVSFVGAELARIKKMSMADVARVTWENAAKLYSL